MILDGRIAICASDLQIYINKTTCQNLSVNAITSMLTALGGKSQRLRGPKQREQSRWLVPTEEFDPAEYCERQREPGDDDE